MIDEVEKIKEEVEILKYYDSQPYFFSKDASAMMAFKSAIKALEKQLKQKPQWHVVADGGLPEEYKNVIVSTKNGGIAIVFYNKKGKVFCDYTNQTIEERYVIAWMELPQPYIAEPECEVE